MHCHRKSVTVTKVRLEAMTKDISELAEGWLRLQYSKIDTAEYASNFWAEGDMWKLKEIHPEMCWEAIVAIIRTDSSDFILGNLAAGPVEELLARHGPRLIERITSDSKRNQQIPKMLKSVWRNDIDQETWSKIAQLAGQRPTLE
jgi:hypothetical protein